MEAGINAGSDALSGAAAACREGILSQDRSSSPELWADFHLNQLFGSLRKNRSVFLIATDTDGCGGICRRLPAVGWACRSVAALRRHTAARRRWE